MWNPIEKLKEMIHELIKDFADAAFNWLKIYMMEPTDFKKYGFIADMHEWILTISITMGIMFLSFNLLKLMVQKMGGYSQRSGSEIFTKSIMGTIFASFSPFIVSLLLTVNNLFVSGIISKGIDVDTFAKFVTFPGTANMSLMVAGIVLTGMFLVLAMQYIVRLGELMVLWLMAPFAAITSANEDMNIWPVWWRETIAVVFQQSLQMLLIWLIFNLMGGASSLNDIILAIALMVIVLKGPALFRKFVYSTGTGRMVVGAAGGVGKAAMFRYAATKMVKL